METIDTFWHWACWHANHRSEFAAHVVEHARRDEGDHGRELVYSILTGESVCRCLDSHQDLRDQAAEGMP